MDPRFSYADSYPDPIPQFFVVEGKQIPSLSWSYRNLHAKEFTVWENAINQSKGELAVYSIESISQLEAQVGDSGQIRLKRLLLTCRLKLVI
jgi:hypothetical protein